MIHDTRKLALELQKVIIHACKFDNNMYVHIFFLEVSSKMEPQTPISPKPDLANSEHVKFVLIHFSSAQDPLVKERASKERLICKRNLRQIVCRDITLVGGSVAGKQKILFGSKPSCWRQFFTLLDLG